MFENPYYHATTRNLIVGFGNLFSNISLIREGTQRVKVPLMLVHKDKAEVRIEADPKLENNFLTTYPRMSFEILGYAYDPTRRANKMGRITCDTAEGTRKAMFSPVPWNIDLALNIITKRTEDAFQIIEQILPAFSPEYTISVNAVPGMNLVQDIPIVLNGVSFSDTYDGDYTMRRELTYILTFTAKVNFYHPVSEGGVIKKVITTGTQPDFIYTATGTLPGDPIIEEWQEK
jgi:hypothetical protein